MALLTARSDRSREMNWIQIGSVAGPAADQHLAVRQRRSRRERQPSAALRRPGRERAGGAQGPRRVRAIGPGLPRPSG
jgi:hypothetical protein